MSGANTLRQRIPPLTIEERIQIMEEFDNSNPKVTIKYLSEKFKVDLNEIEIILQDQRPILKAYMEYYGCHRSERPTDSQLVVDDSHKLNAADSAKVVKDYNTNDPTKPSFDALAKKYKVSVGEIINALLVNQCNVEPTEVLVKPRSSANTDIMLKLRSDKIEFLSRATYEYVQRAVYHNLELNDKLVLEKSEEIKKYIRIKQMHLNQEWLHYFKRSHGIIKYALTSLDTNIALMEDMPDDMEAAALVQYCVDQRRKELLVTIQDRIQILQDYDSQCPKPSIKCLAIKYKLPLTLVTAIIQWQRPILKAYQEMYGVQATAPTISKSTKLNMEDRVSLIQEYQSHKPKPTFDVLALEYNVTVGDILNALLCQYSTMKANYGHSSSGGGLRHDGIAMLRQDKMELLSRAMYEYLQRAVYHGVPELKEKHVQLKVRTVAKYIGIENFSQTKFWLINFLKVHGIENLAKECYKISLPEEKAPAMDSESLVRYVLEQKKELTIDIRKRIQIMDDYDSLLPKPSVDSLADKYNIHWTLVRAIIQWQRPILKAYKEIYADWATAPEIANRSNLSLADRVAVIQLYNTKDPKPKFEELATQYNVCVGEILNALFCSYSTMKANLEHLRSISVIKEDISKLRLDKMELLSAATYEYVQRALNNRIQLNDGMVLQKALEIINYISIKQFKPEKSWLHSFQKVHGIEKFTTAELRSKIPFTLEKPYDMCSAALVSYIVDQTKQEVTMTWCKAFQQHASSGSFLLSYGTRDTLRYQREFLRRAMYEYVQRCVYHNHILNDDLLLKKAIEVSEYIAIKNYLPKELWLNYFKKIHGIEDYAMESLRSTIKPREEKPLDMAAAALVQYVVGQRKEEVDISIKVRIQIIDEYDRQIQIIDEGERQMPKPSIQYLARKFKVRPTLVSDIIQWQRPILMAYKECFGSKEKAPLIAHSHRLNLADCVTVIQEYNNSDPTPTFDALATKYCVTLGELLNILLCQYYQMIAYREVTSDNHAIREDILDTKQDKMESLRRAMVEYVQRAWNCQKNLNDEIVLQKAVEVSKYIHIKDFTPKQLWLNHFKKTNGFQDFAKELPSCSNSKTDAQPLSMKAADLVQYIVDQRTKELMKQSAHGGNEVRLPYSVRRGAKSASGRMRRYFSPIFAVATNKLEEENKDKAAVDGAAVKLSGSKELSQQRDTSKLPENQTADTGNQRSHDEVEPQIVYELIDDDEEDHEDVTITAPSALDTTVSNEEMVMKIEMSPPRCSKNAPFAFVYEISDDEEMSRSSQELPSTSMAGMANYSQKLDMSQGSDTENTEISKDYLSEDDEKLYEIIDTYEIIDVDDDGDDSDEINSNTLATTENQSEASHKNGEQIRIKMERSSEDDGDVLNPPYNPFPTVAVIKTEAPDEEGSITPSCISDAAFAMAAEVREQAMDLKNGNTTQKSSEDDDDDVFSSAATIKTEAPDQEDSFKASGNNDAAFAVSADVQEHAMNFMAGNTTERYSEDNDDVLNPRYNPLSTAATIKTEAPDEEDSIKASGNSDAAFAKAAEVREHAMDLMGWTAERSSEDNDDVLNPRYNPFPTAVTIKTEATDQEDNVTPTCNIEAAFAVAADVRETRKTSKDNDDDVLYPRYNSFSTEATIKMEATDEDSFKPSYNTDTVFATTADVRENTMDVMGGNTNAHVVIKTEPTTLTDDICQRTNSASNDIDKTLSSTLTKFQPINTLEEAMQHLKVLEDFAIFKGNYRAIDLLTQLEDVLHKRPKTEEFQCDT